MGKQFSSLYSYGVVTSRDNLAYSFDLPLLQERVRTFIEIYNTAVDRKRRHDPKAPVEGVIDTNDLRIKWSRQVKASLKKLALSTYEDTHFRTALYRPFCQKYLYFDNFWNEERYQQHRIFPTSVDRNGESSDLSSVITVSEKASIRLMTNLIPDLHTLAAS